jgi:cytidylate kinase
MNNTIITINRECGTGGGEIARLLGEKLGFKVYGRTILKTVAQQFGVTLEEMDRIKSQKTSWWSEFCGFYQQYSATGYAPGAIADPTPKSVYYAEERFLRDLAEKESCIIVGRAGFHIFRDNPNAIHLLLIADRDARIARIARKQNLTLEEAAKVVDDVDKARDNFVESVTDTSRHDARNYHICANITGLDPDIVASFLAEQIRHKIAKV